jgi:lipoate-protein ligase A
MLCVVNPNVDPYFNIASEEYLLKSFSDDIFMLYRNESSVIVGKHQNAFAEVNTLFVKQHNIPVIRRLSGGGAVFHDMGNVNFTFISNGREGSLVDFKKFLTPILTALQTMGVPAEANKRSDLVIEERKISGNAEHVFKNRTLHHGTLLYAAELDRLRGCLKVVPEQFSDRAVRSVRSQVANIRDYMSAPLSVDDFMAAVQQSLLETFPATTTYGFNDEDNSKINQLIAEKYSTWDWNFGYSPKCQIFKSGLIDTIKVSCEITVEKGFITSLSIAPKENNNWEVLQILVNTRYNPEDAAQHLASVGIIDPLPWIDLIFG